MSSKPLDSQVGGHPGVLSDASGSLIMKETLLREIAFYQFFDSVTAPTAIDARGKEERTPTAAALYAFKRALPKYLGTMAVPATATEGEAIGKAAVESIVLENISHLYTRPSILDVKLGTILHDADATPEKKSRMEAQAAKYTAKEMGMRLTGFRTWHPQHGEYVLTDKAYGREIKKEQLPEGIAKFFPDPRTVDDEDANHPAIEPFDANTHTRNLLRVLSALFRTLAHLHTVMSALPIHFVGASFLIVYESDPAALARAWAAVDGGETPGDGLARGRQSGADEGEEWFGFGGTGEARGVTEPRTLRSGRDTPRVQGEVGPQAEDEEGTQPCPPWSVRMIDFAHTRFVDEAEGPMPGVLLGIRNLGDLIRRRIDELSQEQLTRSTSRQSDEMAAEGVPQEAAQRGPEPASELLAVQSDGANHHVEL